MSTKEMLCHLQDLGIVQDFSGGLYGTPDRSLLFALNAGNRLRSDDVVTDAVCFTAMTQWLQEGRGELDMSMSTAWEGYAKDSPSWMVTLYAKNGSIYRYGSALPGLALYKTIAQAHLDGAFKDI